MRNLKELVNLSEPAIDLIREWIQGAEVPCQILPPSESRDETLLNLQVTTRSPLGAVAYDTGGIIIQNGWVRFLGSGNKLLPRRIDAWNHGKSDGYLLVADDAVGGFFAINGGALGDSVGNAYYCAPDDLCWLDLDMGYSELLSSLLTTKINDFYKDLRWPSWQKDLSLLPPDQCFTFYPFLWTKEGSVESSSRATASTDEVYAFAVDTMKQIGPGAA